MFDEMSLAEGKAMLETTRLTSELWISKGCISLSSVQSRTLVVLLGRSAGLRLRLPRSRGRPFR